MEKRASDRRVRRTRQRLQAALIALILEKPYSKITVQNILDRADTGRSTFYAHFLDKEHLLASCFDDLADDLDQRIESSASSPHFLHCQAYFAHAQEHPNFYQAMIEGGGLEIILETGRRHIEASIRDHLEQISPDDQALTVPLPALVNFLSGALLSLLTWWLAEEMPHSPAEMAAMYERLVMPGFRALFP